MDTQKLKTIKTQKHTTKHTRIKNNKTNKTKKPVTTTTLSNLIYKPSINAIFGHNRKHDTTIIFLKKKEYDIFYSGRQRYPILVKETITVNTGKTDTDENAINRSQIVDPFQEDQELPPKLRLTLLDYEKYMAYGGSMGHNAPAGQHKTTRDIYNETFLLSNIVPQDIVLNTGLWMLLENWCKNLSRNNKLTNITVFTGSIPAPRPTRFECGLVLNVPIKMFKIVAFYHINHPGKLYLDIFITNNSPYYINTKTIKYSFNKYLVPVKSHSWFQNFSGIDIAALLRFYGLSGDIVPLRDIVNTDIMLYDSLKLYLKKSSWFGKIVYSKTIDELEKVWDDCNLMADEFGTLEFHEQYYKIVKQKLEKRRFTTSSMSKTIKKGYLFMNNL